MTPGVMELLEPEQVSEALSRWGTVDPHFSNALRSGVSPAQALVKLGIRLCLQERYPDALLVLRAAVTLAPNDPTPLNNLAVVLERAGQAEQAIYTVEHSLALLHAQPDSWIYLGNLKRNRGDLDGAQAAYETVLSLVANSPLAWQALGFVKKDQRQYHEAIKCFITSLKQGGVTAPVLSILGQLFYETGQFEKSCDAYAAALEYDGQNSLFRRMHRETEFICAAIRDDSVEDAIHTYLLACSACPTEDDQDISTLLRTTFSLLSAHGYKEAAKRIGAERVALAPSSAAAAYLLQALSGDSTIQRSPDAYLIECFNEFADHFDDHLVKTLGYDIPHKLGAALVPLLSVNSRVDVLDAGCGTGLCGPWVRDFSASLTGVDLAQRMLEHAHRRGIYDRLVCHELTSFLTNSPVSFDVIVAADVMIYFGDLAPLAAAIANSLRPGGLLAFSTEYVSTPGHQLLSSGRFAHSPDYVQGVFSADFIPCASDDTTVRIEAFRPVKGNIFVFRRR